MKEQESASQHHDYVFPRSLQHVLRKRTLPGVRSGCCRSSSFLKPYIPAWKRFRSHCKTWSLGPYRLSIFRPVALVLVPFSVFFSLCVSRPCPGTARADFPADPSIWLFSVHVLFPDLLADRSLFPEIFAFFGPADAKVVSFSYLLVVCFSVWFCPFVVIVVPQASGRDLQHLSVCIFLLEEP